MVTEKLKKQIFDLIEEKVKKHELGTYDVVLRIGDYEKKEIEVVEVEGLESCELTTIEIIK